MQIRKLTIADYQEVYGLWLSCKGMGLNNLDDSEEGIAQFLNRNPDTCFVAAVDGCIAGVIISGHDGRRSCCRWGGIWASANCMFLAARHFAKAAEGKNKDK